MLLFSPSGGELSFLFLGLFRGEGKKNLVEGDDESTRDLHHLECEWSDCSIVRLGVSGWRFSEGFLESGLRSGGEGGKALEQS